MEIGLLLPPVVVALVGYGTNWLAIRMLFKPRKPVYVLGWKLPFTPGVFIARKETFARQLADVIVDRCINRRDFALALAQASESGVLDHFAEGMSPVARQLLYAGMRKMSAEDIDRRCGRFAETVRNSRMVEDLVTDKISLMSADEIEAMILGVAAKEFGAIAVLGGILGFVAGSVQSILSLLF